MLDTDPRRKPGKKLLDATMFVKWAIIKLLITMHLAMPADILTKAVDLETHTKMRNLMMNIPWATAFYRRVGLPPEREAAGRKPRHQIRNQCSRPHTKMRNVMMNISWATPRNGLALSRHQLTLSRLWREVMNTEGGVPEAVGMLCQSDLRLRL